MSKTTTYREIKYLMPRPHPESKENQPKRFAQHPGTPRRGVFITADQNLQYQQSLKGKFITIFVLKSPNSRYGSLRLLIPNVLDRINRELVKGVIEIEDELFV